MISDRTAAAIPRIIGVVLGAAAVTAMLGTAIAAPTHRGAKVGLGKVLTSKDGREIFGFDINQSGDDGLLATAGSVEIFDQNTGKVTKSLGRLVNQNSDYVAYGIAAGDVGLIDHEVVPDGQLFPKRHYMALNPVSGKKITGKWTPPLHGIIMQQMSEDQSSSITSLFALTNLKQGEAPVLLVADIAANTVSNVIDLDPNLFGPCNGSHLAQYTAANLAYIAASPDCGAVGGRAPANGLYDLSSGKFTQFSGYNNGFFHAGSVNGATVDPNTGVAATTTELNSQVEFYDLHKKKGIAFAQLPCTGDTDQTFSGSGIAVDSVNKLFLVTETYNACSGGSDSAVIVFDEAGNLVESIPGFKLFIGEPAPAINPSKRMGWVFGGPNGWSQLQQFFY
jgi:WD40 repeat protein